MATHFATPFATKNDRENFVEISSKISLLQLKFDEISTRSFGLNFGNFSVAKCCGKMLWQNVVPQEKNSSKRERVRNFAFWQNVLLQHFAKRKLFKFCQTFRCFNSSSDEIRTKFSPKNLWQILWQKRFATKHPTKSLRNLTKFKRKKQRRKSLYQNILQVVGNHEIMVEFDHYIHIYLFIYLHTSIYLSNLIAGYGIQFPTGHYNDPVLV